MSKYRGGFEEDMAKAFKRRKIPFKYELEVLPYKVEQECKYKPDFVFRAKDGHKIYVETKGYFTGDMRKKMKRVIEQHPDKDIRILFQNANNYLISKKKRRKNKDGILMNSMTYGEWCDLNGIKWATANTVKGLGDVIKRWHNENYLFGIKIGSRDKGVG